MGRPLEATIAEFAITVFVIICGLIGIIWHRHPRLGDAIFLTGCAWLFYVAMTMHEVPG
jgi:hypothetical protein